MSFIFSTSSKGKIQHFLRGFILPVIFMIGCSGGASSPISPVQIPTSVEYVGGEVVGDLSVQSGSTLSFVVKDADGTIITNPTGITTELYLPDGTIVVSDASRPMSAMGKASSSETCYGSVAQSGQNFIFTASQRDFSAADRICTRFIYGGSTLNEYCGLVSVHPDDIEASLYTYSTVHTLTGKTNPGPDVASDGAGGVHVCFSGPNVINSTNAGATWSDIKNVSASWGNDARFGCVIEAGRGDAIGNVALGWQNGIAFSTDYAENFDVTVHSGPVTSDSLYNIVDFKYDGNGVLHILNLYNPGSCTEFQTSASGYDLYYRTYDNGTYSTPLKINSSSCDVNSVSTPRLATNRAGTSDYIVWTDTRDSGGSGIQKDLYYAELGSGALVREERISDAPTAPAKSLARDVNVMFDENNGIPIISWTSLYSPMTSPEVEYRTYLEIPSSGVYPFGEFLMDSLSTLGTVVNKGRTNVQSDFAGVLHEMYRNPGGVYYIAATYSNTSRAITGQTTPLLIDSEADTISDVTVDYPGRNFIVWEEPPCPNNVCSSTDVRDVVISRGKLPDCD